MSKIYITLVVLVFIIGGLFLMGRGKKLEAPAVNDTPEDITDSGTNVNSEKVPVVKEFIVTSQNFSFTPNLITVKKEIK